MRESPAKNAALEFVRHNFSGHPKVPWLLKIFSGLASHLWESAERMSSTILLDQDITNESKELFAKCILDLELTSAFSSLLEFTQNRELASCYVDALVIEATDETPSDEPSELDYLVEGTQYRRGIVKYCKAAAYFKTADTDAWLFAREYAFIVTGSPLDFAVIMAVLPITLRIRVQGKWRTEFALTGRIPTPEEQKKAEDIYRRAEENRNRTFSEIASLHEKGFL